MKSPVKLTENQVKEICKRALSNKHAATLANLSYNIWKREAKKYIQSNGSTYFDAIKNEFGAGVPKGHNRKKYLAQTEKLFELSKKIRIQTHPALNERQIYHIDNIIKNGHFKIEYDNELKSYNYIFNVCACDSKDLCLHRFIDFDPLIRVNYPKGATIIGEDDKVKNYRLKFCYKFIKLLQSNMRSIDVQTSNLSHLIYEQLFISSMNELKHGEVKLFLNAIEDYKINFNNNKKFPKRLINRYYSNIRVCSKPSISLYMKFNEAVNLIYDISENTTQQLRADGLSSVEHFLINNKSIIQKNDVNKIKTHLTQVVIGKEIKYNLLRMVSVLMEVSIKMSKNLAGLRKYQVIDQINTYPPRLDRRLYDELDRFNYQQKNNPYLKSRKINNNIIN
jgi:hypothetical protein